MGDNKQDNADDIVDLSLAVAPLAPSNSSSFSLPFLLSNNGFKLLRLNPNLGILNNGNLELPQIQLQHYSDYVFQSNELPSGSRSSQHKMTRRLKGRYGRRSTYDLILKESNERKLRMAANTCNIDLLTRLLDAGADPNAADDKKCTALHLAAHRGNLPIIEKLLNSGANPNVVDFLGNTPLQLFLNSFCRENTNAILPMLLYAGANVNTSDCDGKTALDIARKQLQLVRGSCYVAPDSSNSLSQESDLNEMSELEQRFRNLNTEDKEEVVAQMTAVLAAIERLSISN